ncbi:MAG TPA: DUF3151 domain-containing protein [Acidimicrobiales bacterium]|nr:DUF3151 domain-containing protein [Acidimicrobiales bacterium]
MSDTLGISPRPPETSLGPAPSGAEERLRRALEPGAEPAGSRHGDQAIKAVARAYPQWPDVWAALGDSAGDDVTAYAYFRVGYHRGLDALRKAGWRGSGYVRWSTPENRGFLRCVHGLGRRAAAIGEQAEAARCEEFLRQLDPSWPPDELR